MPTTPYLLSHYKDDIHAHAVYWGLRESGFDAKILNSIIDQRAPPISFECNPTQLSWHGSLFDTAQKTSIWYRRPESPDSLNLDHVAEPDKAFVLNEWKRYLRNIDALSTTMSQAFWVNSPSAASNAENKLVQLQTARACGIAFPHTLVSSDPDLIRDFVKRYGAVIYKPFQIHSWKDAQQRIYSTYTRKVTLDMLNNDESLRLCPGIFQTEVDIGCDVRITVIGKKFFATKYTKDESLKSSDFVDWRVGSLQNSNSIEAIDIPAAVQTDILSLMDKLNIVFGCVDYIIDPQGNYHFIEINQAGQFLFMEQEAPELKILRNFCAMLAAAQTDYAVDVIAEHVTWENYVDSDIHKQWWNDVLATRTPGKVPGVTNET